MKKLTLSITALAMAATSAVASSYISASKVDMDVTAVGTQSAIWNSAQSHDIVLYPQSTISFVDQNANKKNADNKAKNAQMKAIHNGDSITFWLKWSDSSYNSDKANGQIDFYADGFAVQFATDYSDPTQLPYIGMGQPDNPVVVHLQKALGNVYEPNGHGDVAMQVNPRNTNAFEKEWEQFEEKVDALANKKYQRSFVAGGFRSTTEIKDASASFDSNMRYSDGHWYATLTRPLNDAYVELEGTFPVAFAAWDGEKLNRDGLKHITGWTAVKLEDGYEDSVMLSVLNEQSKGDAAAGKEEFGTLCASCHITSDFEQAPAYMAPVLKNIGGYSTLTYLKDSIVDTSKVIVPGYNRNQHPNYKWYTLDEEGNRVSTMPNYDWMSDEQIENIAAYLQTLKKEVE